MQRAIRSRDRIEDGMLSVQESVVLNPDGYVESARAVGGTERFYAQATELELRRVFEPVHDNNGLAVRAHFIDYVSVAPPERWLAHAPSFPEQVDLRTFSITLERTACFGSCPSYKVTISGSGDVTWNGGIGTAVPGTHHAKLPPEVVRGLLEQVRASHLLSALDQYQASWTDNPTYTLTLSVNGLHKQVVDYIGIIVGMPTRIQHLEDILDRTAGTSKWIRGDSDLMPALLAEHWAFASASRENLQLYDSALKNDNQQLVAAFSLAGAPVFSADPSVESPACVASQSSDSHLALAMLSTVPKDRKLPQPALDACLVSAARGGNLELVDLWLKRGASVSPASPPESGNADEYRPEPQRPLLAALQGGSPAVAQRLLEAHAPLDPAHNRNRNLVTFAVQYCCTRNSESRKAILQILLAAGADPNQETETDRPALFNVNFSPELVPLLVAAGARVNQQDSAGKTSLMYTTNVKALRALLEAGTDPTLRDKQGRTAAEQFRAEGLKEQADLLEAAIKARSGLPTP